MTQRAERAIALAFSDRVIRCPRGRCGRRILQVCLPVSNQDRISFNCDVGHTSTWGEVMAANGWPADGPDVP